MIQRRLSSLLLIAAAAFAGAVHADGRLAIEDAWIRAAPPGAAMLAGYATLRNAGDAPLVVRGARSDAFGSVSMHATRIEDGVARMREIEAITLAPGERVVLEPGGRHLMLMRPARELARGAAAAIVFEVGDGASTTTADFIVRDAPGADPHAGH
ncbi:MAG TPA: copper chaperone PCu(A)C [Tahibacter sp.]|uniref:copper chaperone PCu(A)C n=1 Tax=Tahibacter sp. TaxID=2056211 RepID=UPI002C99951F|nr:copper chaperone PCu(A)C [Tahibacter sp.]HSX62875.1 copper chaperone PCu(A)C [Tahibacter sp.]